LLIQYSAQTTSRRSESLCFESLPPLRPDRLWGSPRHLSGRYWDLTVGVRRLERETDHPPPCGAGDENTWNRIATSADLLTMWCLIKHNNVFTFCLLYEIRGQSHCGPGVDSASNRNEYQESSWGVRAADALRLTISPPFISRMSRENVGASTSHNLMDFHGLLQG
jgi:hypothetical protein